MANSPVTFKTHVFNIKYKTIYVVKRNLKRLLVEKLHLNRTNNYPYISGDGFRNLAQHVYDESSDFHPENVQTGDIVFMNPDFIEAYFRYKHPQIKNKYILITQNSDLGIEKHHTDLIDDTIAHWFAKNVLHSHPKVTPIPIGLTNNFLNKIGTTSDMSTIRATDLSHKTTGISFGFSLASGQERIKLQESLKKHTLGFHVFEKTQSAYFKKMSTYSFVASPEGNGADCHRTWEALYLQCIPIAKENYFINHFKELGMPILTIKNWGDVEKFDKEYLDTQYSQLTSGFNHPALFMDYWIECIIKEKQKLFS